MTTLSNIHEERLANGLTLLMVPRPGCGVATVDMWVAAGSAHETPALNGVSHFLEHMLFKGTERYGVGEIDRVVEGVGGLINAGTSHDYTHYHVTVASESFTTALHIIGEVIQHSTLDAGELAKERQVILEEVARKQDDPEGLLWENLYDEMFEKGPYKAPVLGVPETLEAIGRDEMREYYHRNYSPENMVLLIVGDVAPEQALAAAKREFDDFHRTYRPLIAEGETATVYARRIETAIEKEVNETYGVMAFPAPGLGDYRQTYALDVLQFVLGGGRASLLYREIKEKRQLATSIGAGYATSRYPDIFYVAFTCDEAKRSDLEEAVLEQLASACQGPPAPAALDRARKLLINTHAFSLEQTSGEAVSVGYYHTLTGSTEFERNYMAGIAEVTGEEVESQARQWLRPEAMNRVVVRPKNAKN